MRELFLALVIIFSALSILPTILMVEFPNILDTDLAYGFFMPHSVAIVLSFMLYMILISKKRQKKNESIY